MGIKEKLETNYEKEENEELQSLLKEADELCQQQFGMYYQEVTNTPIVDIDLEKIKADIAKFSENVKQLEITRGRQLLDDIGEDTYIDSKFYKLRRIWRKLFEKTVFRQPVFRDIYFHVWLGQYMFKKCGTTFLKAGEKHDVRVHSCIIAPSGTGKSQANNFLATMLELTDLKVAMPLMYNDASAVGSWNSDAEKYNKEKKLKPDDEGFVDPIRYGFLHSNDVIIFDEGIVVLRTGKKGGGSNEWIQTVLQRVANRHGSPANKIDNNKVAGKVEYNAECSFVITSYYLDDFRETLLKKGLIQRSILFIDENDDSKRDDIVNLQIKSFVSLPRKLEEKLLKIKSGEQRSLLITEYLNSNEQRLIGEKLKIDPDMKEFFVELKLLTKFLGKNKTIFVSEISKEKIEEYYKKIKESMTLTPGQQEVFNDIISRLVTYFAILGAQNASMRRDEQTNAMDIQESYKLLWKTTISSIKYIQENVEFELDKRHNNYLIEIQRILRNGIYTKMEINNLMSKEWRVSIGTVITRLKQLKKYFIEVDQGSGNTKYFKLKT